MCSFSPDFAATLSDWNVIVYGTKETPGPKKPDSTTTTTKAPVTTAAPVLQPEVTDAVPERTVQPLATVASNRIDAADEERERGASVAAVLGPHNVPLADPIRVASGVSSGAVHCRPGHWDAAAAACLSTSIAIVIVHLLVSDYLPASLWRRVAA